MVDDPNKTENGSFMEDDYLSADDPATSNTPPKVNIKEVFAQNPKLKIVAIAATIVFVMLAYMVFGGSDKDKPNPDEDISAVHSTPDVSQAPGTAELPPAYEAAVRQANKQAVDTAEATGGSVIPTPIARPSERIEAPVQVSADDPLSEWRREAENRRIERQQQDDASKAAATVLPPPAPAIDPNAAAAAAAAAAQPQNPPLPTVPSAEQIQAVAQQLQQQMQVAIDAQVPTDGVMFSMNIQPAYDIKKYFPDPATTTTTNANGTTTTIGPNGQPIQSSVVKATPKPLISAGTIAYAQIITEANSDVPGPVLAEVASGPLLGGRAIGTFQVAEKQLVLQFNRVVKDGVEYSTQAFALDPATTLPAVVSEVNNHYFSRIMLPAASAFIQGFAEAATQKNTEVVVSNGTVVSNSDNELNTHEQLLKGAKEASNKFTEILDEDSDRPRTVIVHAGTRIGLLFLNSVIDPSQATQQTAIGPNGQPQSVGQAVFNATPYGQAYNAYQTYQQATSTPNSQYNSPSGQPAGLYSSQSITGSNRIQPF